MRFHRGYALAALALFAVEVAIALFVRDRFVRPYLGDTLAVMLVYCGLRAVTWMGRIAAAVIAFLVAAAIEFGQLIGILGLVGLQDNAIARVVSGTGFSEEDFVAYGAGALLVLVIEKLRTR